VVAIFVFLARIL